MTEVTNRTPSELRTLGGRLTWLCEHDPRAPSLQHGRYTWLARQFGGAESRWRRLASGEIQACDGVTLIRVAKYFDCDAHWLATGEGAPSLSNAAPQPKLPGLLRAQVIADVVNTAARLGLDLDALHPDAIDALLQMMETQAAQHGTRPSPAEVESALRLAALTAAKT